MKAADWKFEKYLFDEEDAEARFKAADAFFSRPRDHLREGENEVNCFTAGFARGMAWAIAKRDDRPQLALVFRVAANLVRCLRDSMPMDIAKSIDGMAEVAMQNQPHGQIDLLDAWATFLAAPMGQRLAEARRLATMLMTDAAVMDYATDPRTFDSVLCQGGAHVNCEHDRKGPRYKPPAPAAKTDRELEIEAGAALAAAEARLEPLCDACQHPHPVGWACAAANAAGTGPCACTKGHPGIPPPADGSGVLQF